MNQDSFMPEDTGTRGAGVPSAVTAKWSQTVNCLLFSLKASDGLLTQQWPNPKIANALSTSHVCFSLNRPISPVFSKDKQYNSYNAAKGDLLQWTLKKYYALAASHSDTFHFIRPSIVHGKEGYCIQRPTNREQKVPLIFCDTSVIIICPL